MMEGILCVYLLLCIVFEDNAKYTQTNPAEKVKTFFFICLLPFVILKVISMIACKSPSLVFLQIFGIWLPNFILYGIWSSWAVVSLFFMSADQPVNMALINMAILLIIYSTSICGVFCGLPFFCYKIYQRINDEVSEINLKIWQIKSLPQVPYDPDKFKSYQFCTICMEEFKKNQPVTYLPCDPRHYFHTKCITHWLSKQNVCPLCKIEVNYDKSFKQSTSVTYEQLRDSSRVESSSNISTVLPVVSQSSK